MITPFSQWVGRREVLRDVVDPRSVSQMDVLLGGEGLWPAAGTPLPCGWHWMYFAPRAPQDGLGVDGHPKRGGFMPPVPLKRRMFAGSKLTFEAPLRVGQEITCTREITKITEKNGRSGRLVFVELSEEVVAAGRLAFHEVRTILYREAPVPGAVDSVLPDPIAAAPQSDWRISVQPDPIALFRFSALTFNGHRIHYDRPFAVEVEGYPGLVVQGPYIALLLITAGLRSCPEWTPITFTCRAHAPLFDDAPFELAGKARQGQAGIDLWAIRPGGVIAMTASLGFCP